jgi:hypothetical protein
LSEITATIETRTGAGQTWHRKPSEPAGRWRGTWHDMSVVRPTLRLRRHGGSRQKFCCAAHRTAFHSAVGRVRDHSRDTEGR